MKMNIPFSPPDITDAEINAVVDVLKSGWLTTGPQNKQFEQELAEYSGTPRFALMNSATACMEMALRLLDIGPGDEVITSAYTYTASASVIDHVGAKIVLVDTAPGSLEMDYDQLPNLINERTKAIIPVDIAGNMCDYDRLYAVLDSVKDRYTPQADTLQTCFDRVVVIADAAHSFGATYKGQRAGQVADFTSFSFHAVKNLTTAEGGALTWKANDQLDDDMIYQTLMTYILHGQTKDALAKTKLGSWEYDIVAPLYKANMTDIMAAIGRQQLIRYPQLMARRHEIIARYNEGLKDLPVHTPCHASADGESSGHLYLLRLADYTEAERNDFIVHMAEQGIATNVHYKPLPMLTAYKNLGFKIEDYPNAFAMYQNEVTLPLHTLLTNEQVDYIITTIRDYLVK